MTPSLRRLASTLAVCALALVAVRATAADVDPAATRINGFYDVLLDTMKTAQRTPVKARYDKLEPAIRATFDLATMTRIAVGPTWATLAPDDQRALVDQFGRFIIATYAARFDGYSGEHFEIEPAAETRGVNRVVHTMLVRTKGDPVSLNYLLRPGDDGWKTIDIYLSGTISELATRRSEFGSLLKNVGVSGLIDTLRTRADRLLQPA